MRRFALHIVPPYFRRLRYAGILGQGKRTRMLVQCRELLADRVLANAATVAEPGSNDSETAAPDEVFEPDPSAPEPPKTCPRCRAREFVFIECYWPWENYDDLGVAPPDAETSSSGQVVLVASPEDRAQLVPP